jgi:ParB family transcriptional regulator, chromosome partitioning protein
MKGIIVLLRTKSNIMEIAKLLSRDLNEGFHNYRMIEPEQVDKMVLSLSSVGQLHPIVVQKTEDSYNIIDGVKRFRASMILEIEDLDAFILDVDNKLAKALILHYNRKTNSLNIYEQGMIVYSLVHDHKMQQQEIALYLKQSRSWVCRRLGIIEHLTEEVLDALRMGNITITHARDLVKLPRGNQSELLKVIINQKLSSRDSKILISLYEKANDKDRAYILAHSRQVITQSRCNQIEGNVRLSIHGNKILKSMELFRLQLNILGGQLRSPASLQLNNEEYTILVPPLNTLIPPMNYLSETINKMNNHEK